MKARGILVKVRGPGDAFANKASRAFGASSTSLDRILTIGSGADSGSWFSLRGRSELSNPWDGAHALFQGSRALGAAATADIVAIEPDWVQEWPTEPKAKPDTGARFAARDRDRCAFDDQDGSGGRAIGPELAWNLGDQYSQLKNARDRVGPDKQKRIVIAHVDTGYDPQHVTVPRNLDTARQRNFIDGQPVDDAVDRAPQNGGPLSNRGHGPATLGQLAGSALDGTSPGWPDFTDFIGGAPFATVVPIRIADGVVHFTTSSMVKGFRYATSIGAHILSMSMGGLSSDLLVDAVNEAYEQGVFMVTAAGNSYANVWMPNSIVFPARYRRVLAATGIMANGRSYSGLHPGTMQGNYGPASKMDTALGAYTPNVPWPQMGCPDVVNMSGAGTSSATPQIAAAAALWMAEHWDAIKSYAPWARVEATRAALFKAARLQTAGMDADEIAQKVGRGVMQAEAALAIGPARQSDLRKLPPARPSWPWLDLLTEGGVSIARHRLPPGQLEMLKLELTQMAQRVGSIDRAIDDPDTRPGDVPVAARNRYLELCLDEGNPSKPLRAFLERHLSRPAKPASAAPATPPIKRKERQPPIPRRRLRVYSLDPSIAQSNDFFAVNQTVLSLPWDDKPLADEGLRPGPVGEYLEVIDIDPASDRVYAPVDLNDQRLLAQDGWAPSEGNPQFHQQMVYAVGMYTIGNFERALGRKALWAHSVDERGRTHPVPRLRIYPHALRTDNAYYSPEKMAILFGYFPASDDARGVVVPGSMVFTCLSSDIVAHEMSHALLDGLHRRFQEASNPDVIAFHEAFADIVALFQHFTFKELVRFEISRVRGDLSGASLLSGLAQQFGQGTGGRSGPLRNYTDPATAQLTYESTSEPHERGSILVYAIYEAFLKIVSRRTADLIRLASNGSGILQPGALHPDLVERLSDETCKVAQHILHICIRALDYCPAVDITFGEYLRGMITADVDTVPEDRFGYRVALIEAFRNRRILPRDVRTISEETLGWSGFDDPTDGSWVARLLANLDLGWNLDMDRSEVITVNESNRWSAWTALNNAFKSHPELMPQFGLLPGVPRYGSDGIVARSRNKDAATTFDIASVRPARRQDADGSFRTEVVANISQRQPVWFDPADHSKGFFWFRGGATVIIDPRKGHERVRYSIVKNSGSQTRQQRQRELAGSSGMSAMRTLYFAGQGVEPFAMMHAKNEDE
jgi:hypothetical protein